MRAALHGLVLAAAAAGCQDLAYLPPGVCDNGALEVGEDCDLFADPALGPGTRCQGCRYTCGDGAVCPAGWGCGADGTCAHATGSFREAPGSPYLLATAGPETADLDGDGRIDIAGFVPGGVVTLLGDAGGAFRRGPEYVLPEEQTGSGTIADLDGDGRADVVLPFAAGLVVLRGDPARGLAPVIYAPYDAVGVDDLWWIPLQARGVGPEDAVLSLRQSGDYFLAGIVLLPGGTAQIDRVTSGGPPLAALGDRVPVADADPGRDGDEFVLAFAGATEVTVHGTAHHLDGRLYLRELARLAVPPVDAGARFADVDGDGRLDVLVSAGSDQVYASLGDGAGGFAPVVEAAVFARLAAASGAPSPAGRRWPLAAADLDGDGRYDYVGADGVYRSTADDLVLAAARATPTPWREAAVADFNRDGRADVAAVADGWARVELLLADGNGGFNSFLIDTATAPRSIRAADVDGDFVTDLAFIETVQGGTVDSVSVIFGATSGGPSDPISMGQLSAIERLEPGRLRGPHYPYDGLADLAIVAGPDDDVSRSLGFLGGSSVRAMVSPFALHRAGLGDDTPLAVLAGGFASGRSDAGLRDLVAVGVRSSVAALWLLPGHTGARLSLAEASRLSAGAILGTTDAFDPSCATFAAGDVDGDGVDELVGIDQRAGCASDPERPPALAVVSLAPGAETAEVTALALPAPPDRIALADLDGDGRPDLLAAGGGTVTVLWNDGAGLAAASSSTVAGDHAAVLNADADVTPELAVVSAGTVVVVDIVDRSLSGLPSAVAATGPVRAADLDGDGIDDLVIGSEGRVAVYLAVRHREDGL